MKVVVILSFLVLPEESAGALEPRCSSPSDQESQVRISWRDSTSVAESNFGSADIDNPDDADSLNVSVLKTRPIDSDNGIDNAINGTVWFDNSKACFQVI